MMRDAFAQLPLAFGGRRSYARVDFVPGASNEQALAAVDAWPDWPARVCALWGQHGSGKTHLAQIWRALANADLLSADELTDERVVGLPAGGSFLIDDADAVDGGTALFHLLNFIEQSKGWLLMTSVRPPQHWPTLLPDLHSRLTAVPAFALTQPDEGLIARVLLKLFADRQLKIPEAMIGYLVPRLRRSFADAEQIVAIIDALTLQQRRNASVEVGAQALKLLEAGRRAGWADSTDGLV